MIRPGLFVLASLALAAPASAASVQISNVPGPVVVLPEDRPDVAVTIIRTDPNDPIRVTKFGDQTMISGRSLDGLAWMFGPRLSLCGGYGPFGQAFSAPRPPVALIRTPEDVTVEVRGGAGGAIAHSRNLDLLLHGCGDWTVGDVAGRLSLRDTGSSDVRTGQVGSLALRLNGSGDIRTQAVAGGLDAEIHGSGGVRSASASGPVRIRVFGSGDVDIGGGRTPFLDMGLFGSGDVAYRGVAADVNLRVSGSGDVRVEKATGRVTQSVSGSGDVDIGR